VFVIGIETVEYVSSPEDPDYEPKFVKPGKYYCYNYPKCKGEQVIPYKDGELKPCPICGKSTMCKW